MAYPTLEKLFYKDASSRRYENHREQFSLRLEAESTFRTGVMLEHGELFCAIPRELSVANERILRRERRVSALWKALPPVALGAFLRSLILDEVVYSNEIEGVHSTRRQIEIALNEAKRDTSSLAGASERPHAPFMEFTRLYLGLTDNPQLPSTLQDIRDIYDAVVRDSLDEKDQIKHSLFRTRPVVIESNLGKVLHEGVTPEATIKKMLEQMLDLMHSEDIPETYSALLAHFLFEYIHPFYDGNGRTGRYLLALSLSAPLSQPTVLSLSRVIAENKSAYYKAFDITERPLNCSEATHFVMTMLDLIGQAQEDLIADLQNKRRQLDNLGRKVDSLDESFSERDRDLLFFVGQLSLFDALEETGTRAAANHLRVSTPTARKALESLRDRGLVGRTSTRPAIYRLSEQGKLLLGTSDSDISQLPIDA